MRTQVLMAAVGLVLSGFGAGYPTDLIYYSKLDSAADITAPQVGAAGTIGTASFQTGKTGNALYVPADYAIATIPFSDGLGAKGCIEFDLMIKNNADYFNDGADPFVFTFQKQDGGTEMNPDWGFAFTANDGSGRSGALAGIGSVALACTWPNSTGYNIPYSDVLGSESPKGWHHYKIIWNFSNEKPEDIVALYIDGERHGGSLVVAAEIEALSKGMSQPLNLTFSAPHAKSKSPFLIDEFKVWNTDTPSGDIPPVELPVVSEVTAKQHYPWCGKVDIGYTVAGSTDGLLVKISVKDNDNNVEYVAKTFDVDPTAAAGAHTVVWDATADGVKKVSKNMVATVSLIVPAE